MSECAGVARVIRLHALVGWLPRAARSGKRFPFRPRWRLGGIERLEDLGEIRTANPFALIDDFGDDSTAPGVGTCAEHDGAAIIHGVHRVEQERHDDLHELLLTRHDRRQGAIDVRLHGELLEARVMLEEKQGLLDHRVDVEQCPRQFLRAAEVEDSLDDALTALHFMLDELQRFGERTGQAG